MSPYPRGKEFHEVTSDGSGYAYLKDFTDNIPQGSGGLSEFGAASVNCQGVSEMEGNFKSLVGLCACARSIVDSGGSPHCHSTLCPDNFPCLLWPARLFAAC